MTTQHRPDPRPPEEVWKWFDAAFEGRDFPNVSSMLGSDWGWGSPVLTAEQYKQRATERMVAIYGPRPMVRRPINTGGYL